MSAALKRKWGEVINPSDKIHICIDDAPAAALAVYYVSRGGYGLRDEKGEQLLPILAFGGDLDATFEHQFKAKVDSVSTDRIVAAAHTAQYGDADEIEGIEAALEGLPDADERRKKYEDVKRTSMSRIVDAFHAVKKKATA